MCSYKRECEFEENLEGEEEESKTPFVRRKRQKIKEKTKKQSKPKTWIRVNGNKKETHIPYKDYEILHSCVLRKKNDPRKVLVTEDVEKCRNYSSHGLENHLWEEMEHDVFQYLHNQHIFVRNGKLFILRRELGYWKKICSKELQDLENHHLGDVSHTQYCQLLHNRDVVKKLVLCSQDAVLEMNTTSVGLCACRITTVDPSACFVYDEHTHTIKLDQCYKQLTLQHSSHCCSRCIMFFILHDTFHVKGPGQLIVQNDRHFFTGIQKWKITKEAHITIMHDPSILVEQQTPMERYNNGSIKVSKKSSVLWFSSEHTSRGMIQCKQLKATDRSHIHIEKLTLAPRHSFVASANKGSSISVCELTSLYKTVLSAKDVSCVSIGRTNIVPDNTKVSTTECSMVHLLECECMNGDASRFREMKGIVEIGNSPGIVKQ